MTVPYVVGRHHGKGKGSLMVKGVQSDRKDRDSDAPQ